MAERRKEREREVCQLSGRGGVDERKEKEKNNFASWYGLKKEVAKMFGLVK